MFNIQVKEESNQIVNKQLINIHSPESLPGRTAEGGDIC